MPIIIRQAVAGDLAVVKDMTERAYAVWLPVLKYPPVPLTEDYVPRIAAGTVFLAQEGEAVCGLIVMEHADEEDTIFSVAVDPDHAGKGIGPRMMSEMEDRARASGKQRMTLYTNALMERNIGLYRKLGYTETGRRPNPARPVFTIVDMVKPLR